MPTLTSAQKALARKVADANAAPGDVLLIRAEVAPPVPAGVSVVLLPPGEVVKMTSTELFDAGFVRRK